MTRHGGGIGDLIKLVISEIIITISHSRKIKIKEIMFDYMTPTVWSSGTCKIYFQIKTAVLDMLTCFLLSCVFSAELLAISNIANVALACADTPHKLGNLERKQNHRKQ